MMIPRFHSLIMGTSSTKQQFIHLFGLLLCWLYHHYHAPSSSLVAVWVSAFQQQPQPPQLSLRRSSSYNYRHNHESIFIISSNNGLLFKKQSRRLLSTSYQRQRVRRQDLHSSSADDDHDNVGDDLDVEDNNDNDNNNDNIKKVQIRWIPYSITIKNVCYTYPNTYSVWRKLTSSVPRRTLAIDNLSVEFCSGIFQLIVGASSSGKSTLLQLILGCSNSRANDKKQQQDGIQPDSGIVELVVSCDDKNDGKEAAGIAAAAAAAAALVSTTKPPCPILLDQKPTPFDYSKYGNKNPRTTTIQQLLSKTIDDTFQQSQIGIDMDSMERERLVVVAQQCLLDEINEIFQFESTSTTTKPTTTTKQINDKTLDQLSPSESYIVALAIATIESSIGSSGGIRLADHRQQQEELVLELPSPIILLDEWMDTETSVVVRNVQNYGIERLLLLGQHITTNTSGRGGNGCGGIVLSVTHKPQLYSTTSCSATSSSTTTTNTNANAASGATTTTGPITFCRGTILPSSTSSQYTK